MLLADLEQAKALADGGQEAVFCAREVLICMMTPSASDLLLIRDAQEKALAGDFDGTRAVLGRSGFCQIVYEETERTCG